MTDLPPDLEALLFDAAADALSPEDAERLRAHMTADPGLADLIAQQRHMAAQVSFTDGLSELEQAALHRAVRTAEQPAASAPWVRWAFAVAAVVVVVTAGSFALLDGGADLAMNTAGIEDTSVADASDGAESAEDTGEVAEEAPPSADMAESATRAADEAAEEDALYGATEGGDSAVFPACTGEIEEPTDASVDATTQAWPSIEEAAAAIDAAGAGTYYAGDPLIETNGDVAVLTWVDVTGSLLQQVQLRLVGDEWAVTARITCDQP